MKGRKKSSGPLTLFVLVTCLSAGALFGQKKKELKKNNIRGVLVTETVDGKTINDSKSYYSVDGRLMEELNYDKTGVLKSWKKYKWNSAGNLTEEAVLDSNKTIIEKKLYKYNALNQKTEEQVVDSKGKLLQKSMYFYDKRGLKSEKKIYGPDGKLVSVKKYSYQTEK
jgi:hypothetical protein